MRFRRHRHGNRRAELLLARRRQTYTYRVAGIAHAGGARGSVWRSNLSETNRSVATANLTLTYRMTGNTVTRTYMLPNSWIKEWEDVAASLFNQGTATSGAIGYATVEVRTAAGLIWAYGSVVDNGTGDPTTIVPFIE